MGELHDKARVLMLYFDRRAPVLTRFHDDPIDFAATICDLLAENERQAEELRQQAEQRGEVVANTGNAEADRVINRLMSADPDFDDCEDAAELIRRLAAPPTPVVPDGWRLYSADASIIGRCSVLLTLDPVGTKRWHAMSQEQKDLENGPALFVTGQGVDFHSAFADACRAVMLAAAPEVAAKGVKP